MNESKNTSTAVVVSANELSKVDHNLLNKSQLQYLLQKTPEVHVYERPAKGGGVWKYVTGVYVKKVLNLMFGWNWNFEVVEHKFDLAIKQAYVLGRLTVKITNPEDGKTMEIVKMQFGRAEIKFKTGWKDGKKVPTNQPLDIGNDLKAATTDALKKCASELGIASDIYGSNEFKEIKIIDNPEALDDEEKLKKILEMFDKIEPTKFSEGDIMNIERIIESKESSSYNKVIKLLSR